MSNFMRFSMKYFKSILILVISLLIHSQIFSAAVGKIAGHITDLDTEEGLIGANVVITHVWDWENKKASPFSQSIGAAADLDGDYVILNVPPGTYNIKISMMGYTAKIIEKIQVSINRTTTLDATLSSSSLSVEEVVVQAKKEVIKKDLTSSIQTISAEELQTYNIESIGEAVSLTAGVVDGHFRGGRGGGIRRGGGLLRRRRGGGGG